MHISKIYSVLIGLLFTVQLQATPVNAVIGNQGYYDKYGEMPDAETSEIDLIQAHLEYVACRLAESETNHLSTAQILNRKVLINLLLQYSAEGCFPQNLYSSKRTPVFIDHTGTVCAVGYLVQQTEGQQLVEAINTDFQLASIYDMDNPDLAKWMDWAGLSIDECAMIQPTYEIPIEVIKPRPVNNSMFAMELQKVNLDVKIVEQSAVTTVQQTFFNPSNNQLEGYYYFPLPKNSTIEKFTMWINGVETEGELLDAAKAKGIYEEIVRKAKDPALLEYYNQQLLKVRIFPIQPKSEQKVKLIYKESLAKDNGTVEYQFPLKHKLNTVKPLKELVFKVSIETKAPLRNVICPSHNAEINIKSNQLATVGFEGKSVKQESDLKIYFNTDDSKIGLSMINHFENREGYFFANISPGKISNVKPMAKDVVFVLDKSGSMAGKKMSQAKKALKFCLENLNSNDRFEIVAFSTEAEALFGEVNNWNKATKDKAVDFVEDLKPIGGTNIDEALEFALAARKGEERPSFIIFLTDGKPTIGETREDELLKAVEAKNAKNTRIFTFGIGTELNTHLLDKLTEMTKAHRTYVLPDEDIEVKVSDFFTKVSSPILTNVKLTFDKSIKVNSIYPKTLPDLFSGSTLSVLGKFKGHGKGKVTLEGLVNGKKETFTYRVNWEEKDKNREFIADLWAARAVGYLLDQIRLRGENKELIEEVVRLSKKHGIITPYTSFLIIEDEAISMREGRLDRNNSTISNRIKVEDVSAVPMIDVEELKKNKSGEGSVRTSSEIQAMNDVENIEELSLGKEQLDFETVLENEKILHLISNRLMGEHFI